MSTNAANCQPWPYKPVPACHCHLFFSEDRKVWPRADEVIADTLELTTSRPVLATALHRTGLLVGCMLKFGDTVQVLNHW